MAKLSLKSMFGELAISLYDEQKKVIAKLLLIGNDNGNQSGIPPGGATQPLRLTRESVFDKFMSPSRRQTYPDISLYDWALKCVMINANVIVIMYLSLLVFWFTHIGHQEELSKGMLTIY